MDPGEFDVAREPRPRLIPVRVPWQIETFDPHLTLLVSETPAEPTEAVFYARVLNRDATPSFELHVIKVRFREARGGRLVPGENDMPCNPADYDCSGLASGERFWEDPQGSVRAQHEEWRQNGVCPDPGFYRVFPSPWMRELCIDDEEVQHYLAVGRSAIAEVLAEGWDWETVEILGPAPPPLPGMPPG